MGPYNIPRNVKDEGRILFIFTGKSIIYTVATGLVGMLFYCIFAIFNLNLVGVIIVSVFALIGFCIGTFKIPNVGSFGFTKKVGGENIDDVIIRAVKFRARKNKIYVYEKEEVTEDE